jgi:hypothetical protein
MIARRIGFIGAVLLAGLSGLLGGALIVAGRGPGPELWEISPEFRRNEVDGMFADYQAGRISYTLQLPVMGRELKVRILKEMRVTYEGFVPLKELGDEPTRFWYSKNGECGIRQYDADTLFVQIKTKYALTLKREGISNDPRTINDHGGEP